MPNPDRGNALSRAGRAGDGATVPPDGSRGSGCALADCRDPLAGGHARDTLRRFREYEKLGVRYIVQMDPEDRTTHQFIGGDLVHRDLTSLETPGGGSLPFDTRELLARLDDEPGELQTGN